MGDSACPLQDPASASAARTALIQDPDNSIGNLAKKAGMSDKCVNTANTQTQQVMNDAKVAAIGLWGAAAGASTTTDNTLDHDMMQSGCGAFALTANTILSSTSNMSCNFNSTTSGATTTTNGNESVILETVAPSDAVVASINATIASNFSTIAILANSINTVNQKNNESDEKFAARLQRISDNVEVLKQLAQDYQDNNPTQGDIRGSNLQFSITSGVTVKASQEMTNTMASSIIQHAKDVAGAVAFNKLSQATGVDSLSPESKTMIQDKINTEFNNQAVNINHLITKNNTSVNQSGEIKIRVAGSIIGSTINTNLKSQMDVAVSQVVKAAVNVGSTVATSIIGDIHTADETTTLTKGLSDLLDSANKGLADEITQADAGQNTFFSGFFSMITNIIMLIAFGVLAVVFFVPIVLPSLAGLFPPFLKQILIAIVVYLIVAWVISWPPFSNSTKDTRMDEVMRIPDNRKSQGMRKPYTMTRPESEFKSSVPQFKRPYTS